jgi:hypothetical protein
VLRSLKCVADLAESYACCSAAGFEGSASKLEVRGIPQSLTPAAQPQDLWVGLRSLKSLADSAESYACCSAAGFEGSASKLEVRG